VGNVYLIGVLAALVIAAYGVAKYRKGSWRKADLLLALLVSAGIVSISLFPQIGNVLTLVFRLENRLFALLVFSNLLLFGMFFYLLNQVRAQSRRNGELVRALARRSYEERYAAEREPREENGAGRDKLLVIIPAYNEQEAIRGVLAQVPGEILGHKVNTLVVVDGATDGTEAVAAEHNFPVATHVVNLGQGDALRTGFEIARLEDADIVVSLDADGQHRPEEIERLVAPVVADEADYVMGSRFLGHYEEAGGFRHKGIVFFSWLVSLLSRQKITDSCNGFRAIRGRELHKLDLREDRFSAAELILEAVKKKLRVKEVPISILRRAEGESKKPRRLGYPLGFLRVTIRTWLR
jgi:hypothetical protein